MKVNEFKESMSKMDRSELITKAAEIKEELFKLRVRAASSQVEKPHLIRVLKRNYARILTKLNAKAE